MMKKKSAQKHEICAQKYKKKIHKKYFRIKKQKNVNQSLILLLRFHPD